MMNALRLIFLFLAVLNGCGSGGGEGEKKKEKGPHLVKVVTVETRPMQHATVRTGTLTAQRQVKIFNQEEGRITHLTLYEGDAVGEGDLLVGLDDLLLRAELEKTRANRERAESELKRILALGQKNLSTEEKRVEAETALKVSRAEERQIETRLEYAQIRAPFAGIITERHADPGDVAPRHTHLLSLIDAHSLYTELMVSELLLPHFRIGDSAEVRIDALGEQSVPGRIQRIHPTVDPRTRLGIVEVRLTEVPKGAAAGQLCRVTLRTREVARRVVPFAALQRDREGEYLFLAVEGKADKRKVVTGLRLGDELEIIEGVADGEAVIMRGFLDLSPGKDVEVVTPIAAEGQP